MGIQGPSTGVDPGTRSRIWQTSRESVLLFRPSQCGSQLCLLPAADLHARRASVRTAEHSRYPQSGWTAKCGLHKRTRHQKQLLGRGGAGAANQADGNACWNVVLATRERADLRRRWHANPPAAVTRRSAWPIAVDRDGVDEPVAFSATASLTQENIVCATSSPHWVAPVVAVLPVCTLSTVLLACPSV